MAAHARPIRHTLMTVILLTCGAVMLITSAAFIAYEYVTFRQLMVRNVKILGEAIAANSTAALAFVNADDAREVLAAFKAQPHVVAARLYLSDGQLIASYPDGAARGPTVQPPRADGYRFENGLLTGVQAVVQGGRRMGTLYLESDLGEIYEHFQLFVTIGALIMLVCCVAAYLISRRLQELISRPILALATTAQRVSEHRDYSVRATRPHGYEFGLFTDAFNHMLTRIEGDQTKLRSQLSRLDLLHRITRATGERHDLRSVFRVVLHHLGDDLPLDFACMCVYEASAAALSIAVIDSRSAALAVGLGLAESGQVPIDQNGLARCVAGELVYEPDTHEIKFPFPQRFAQAGLHALVVAPLLVESRVFGVLVAARREADSFSSADCEFLRQLSEHVALAAHQAQLYGELQRAYDDLRQSQQAIMQQERLRALGEMASGIAHDINNAISPAALYTESLLEREPGLSERARSCLTTIQTAIEDVAETVSRMREFYRPRETEMVLSRVACNRVLEQVINLTRARWSDLPQQRGVVIQLRTELAEDLPPIMGSEVELRDALTNLIFNAVDAMPDGGTLTLRTRLLSSGSRGGDDAARQVQVEVADTGIGMAEETRRRCLEPFYTTKGERGTGLGLAMVYGMVQRHSAELDIDSAVGRGTTVRLSFAAADALAVPLAAGTLLQPAVRRLRILLVDDDPMLIKSLRDILEQDGHVVTVAEGGQQGIDSFAAALAHGPPFSIVITDLGMPYVDGRKVAASVKAAATHTPVILLTGWGKRLLAENDIPAHVDRVLSKPPRLGELRAALAKLVPPPDPAEALVESA
ncbi:MAG: response regulator [Gammaproteobacteria bacterium]|nr:MAG: response regulator [Gammaproteobacteria bacterium]